ncbi:heterokaryon incompatibility protein-domain-containing protein [Plectosphaerella plurivora]|uniref:Heterokaryon incompatibility protein-domain-containing protein n=1 Tax=Plectosphaerella plurivora TaxID=936078 RepID=A0A9P9A391_9PEZI|nr:heterokaryon incompatibility protein-domain-containing protein [Plectosphaerella plurivora]
MAEREGRYRRTDDHDDDSLSPSSLSPSPPPPRRRRTPPRDKPVERDTRDRLRDDDRYAASPRLPPERESSRLTKSRDPRESRHPRDDRDSPPPFQAKRQSITDRLRNSWQARKDDMRGTPPPPPPNAAGNRPPSRVPSRRSSSAGQPPAKTTPIGKVREWLDNCSAYHGDHCVGTAARPPSAHSDDSADDSVLPPRGEPPTWRPIWLIDAVERRLVRARATDRYMALSYVYERAPAPSPSGRNAPRETRRDNVGMLTDHLDDADMPQAISDGIWLARKLGIKLLWVDRFCIVQDDDAEREEYLRNMGHVFANAYLTVVAAAGENADTGLSALVSPGGRAPPPVPKEALGPPGRKGHEEMLRATRWTERCWTMVEGFYARRALFVYEETMTWECHCATWNLAGDTDTGAAAGGSLGRLGGLQRVLSLRGGAAPAGPGGRQQTGHRKCTAKVQSAALGFRHPPWPDLDEYARMCMEYSSRRLNHPEDTLDAFRGFTAILAKSFAGGFTFGMPALFLDAALLWRPSATIRRRQLPPTINSGGLNPVPSWSWMGWYFDGVAPDLTLWRASADYVLEANMGQSGGKGGAPSDADGPRRRFRSAAGLRLRTTCQFHVTDRATTAPVRNDGTRFRNMRHQGRRGGPQLPLGWSKSNSTGGFRHDSDGAALFKYPVPMATDIPASDLPIGGELIYPGTLLSFNTTRAMLQVDFGVPFPAAGARRGPRGKPAGGDEGGIPLAIGNILAPRGKWIGTLRSHDAWLGLQGANYEGEEKLELIAVSEGNERVVDGGARPGAAAPVVSDVWGPGCDMEAVRAHADQDGILDFVNVLWVERVGGVCFRRGVGHVFVQAWEAFARERVEILLG